MFGDIVASASPHDQTVHARGENEDHPLAPKHYTKNPLDD